MTTENATETTVATPDTHGILTAQDIKAIKQADRVCFDHSTLRGGELRLIKEVKNRGPFDDREKQYEVSVHSRFHGKHANGEVVMYTNSSCFEMEHCGQYSDTWNTVKAFVKVGDEITLEWYADGGNDYIRGSTYQGQRIYCDHLKLIIRRKMKNGETARFGFSLRTSTCPDNTARMVRLARA